MNSRKCVDVFCCMIMRPPKATLTDTLVPDPALFRSELTRQMVEIFRPFDYGRYEFRLDLETGEVRMLEVNLNCNLWSEKVYGQRLQEQLIETILCERSEEHTSELQSLMRI